MMRGESGINCLIAVDKPVGPSSHDVVNRVRRALGERRVGHAGTLDPAASGVLVVGVGQATRLLGMLTLDTKEYDAAICFGRQTTTDDAEGETLREEPVPAEFANEAFAKEALSHLVGTYDQVPPDFSAISVGGKRAYETARAGQEVKLEPRRVTVEEARLEGIEAAAEGLTWHVHFRVSKGTYVRALARDLGLSLGSAAHLSGLRRTKSGVVSVSGASTLDELAEMGAEGVHAHALDPIVALGHPFRSVSARELEDVSCGRRIDAGLVVDTDGAVREPYRDELVSLVSAGKLVGVWRRVGSSLKAEANFPTGIEGVGNPWA